MGWEIGIRDRGSGNTGAAAQRGESKKDRLYERDYERKPAPAPPSYVKGFGQETGGPLGDCAKTFLRPCACPLYPPDAAAEQTS